MNLASFLWSLNVWLCSLPWESADFENGADGAGRGCPCAGLDPPLMPPGPEQKAGFLAGNPNLLKIISGETSIIYLSVER